MKKANILHLIVAIVSVALLTGCGGIKKMAKDYQLVDYKVQPQVLEMHNDLVDVTITGTFPEKYFSKKAIVTITPVLKYANGEKAFKAMVFQGESVEANNQAISFETGGSIDYHSSIPYTDDMKVSELVLRINAAQGSKSIDFPEVKIADGVIATPRLLQVDAKAFLGTTKKINYTPAVYDPNESEFQRVVPDAITADILYLIQQSSLRSSELKQDDIKYLKDYLKETAKNERIDLKDVEISSYASPDGEYGLNEKLSDRRGSTAEKFIKRELKRAKYSDVALDEKTTPEDWEGFKELVSKSDIQDKDIILRVLSMYSDLSVREEQIKNMSATFKVLADEILPQLRRSKLKVNVDLIGKTDEEILELAQSNPDSLNPAELLYAAKIADNADQKMDFYKAFSRVYPKDWRGPNNVGYLLLAKNDVQAAKAEFEKAKNLNDNAYVLNNLGVCEILSNNFAEAENYFQAALSAGKKAAYNLALCQIKKAQYADAISNMGTCTSFNAALAKVLNKDNNGALSILESKEEPSAMDYYLKAVIGARTSNDDLLINSLKTAINKDATLAAKAKSDLEFYKYFENAAFQNLVK